MKARKSILDPFRDQLEAWDAEGLTLMDMQKKLAELSCGVSIGLLSGYLERRRSESLQSKLFTLIASGGRMNSELDAAFKANPEPDIEQLIRLTKTLVMSLQVQGQANPDLLSLANSMQQTVL